MVVWRVDPQTVLDTWTDEFLGLMFERAGQRIARQEKARQEAAREGGAGGTVRDISPQEMAAVFAENNRKKR